MNFSSMVYGDFKPTLPTLGPNRWENSHPLVKTQLEGCQVCQPATRNPENSGKKTKKKNEKMSLLGSVAFHHDFGLCGFLGYLHRCLDGAGNVQGERKERMESL